MPFTTLDPADIEAGKPVKEELFSTIKDNEDDHESRIAATEQNTAVDIVNLKVTGNVFEYDETELTSRMPTYKSPVDQTIVNVLINLLTVSTSGDLELELDRSQDNGVTWVPILSSPVTLSGTTVGSLSGAVNFVSAGHQTLNQNDMLRLRITGVQVDQGEFHVSIYGELA